MLGKIVCNFIIIAYLIHLCSSLTESPEVDTRLGRVKGFWKTSVKGRKYAAFEGIPYAQPPVGDLRFEEPQPITPWSGTWLADTLHTCLQNGSFGSPPMGDEDCLYLNIYLPAEFLDSSKKLDVIFSIHGGAFMVGSGHFLTESSNFMDKDVVLVTINYRLGILGFLSTEDEVIPGNNGLKDQSFALKWVRDNIASFRGNPESVTIIGLSAGGASVHFHYLSPLSRGLFHKGVAQSGTALAPWVIKEEPLKSAKKLGVLVGCPVTSTKELKKCLKQRPGQNLVGQLPHFYGYDFMPFSPFAPVIEKVSRGAFIDKEPYLILKEGNVADVPMITSTAADEGLLTSAILFPKLDEIGERWTELLCHLLDCNETLPESRREAVGSQILDHYVAGEKISTKNVKQFTQISTDRLFAASAQLTAKLQASVTKSPVYYYLFNYHEGENKMTRFFAPLQEIEGVAHCEDCVYCYGVFQMKPLSKQDERLRDYCQDMFYTFASTGKPSFGPVTWQPTGSAELTYLNITNPDNIKVQKTKDFASVDFWNSLGILENERAIVKDEL